MAGRLPSELKLLTALKSLILPRNKLSNTIPAALAEIPTLTRLLLSRNSFTGVIPNVLFLKLSLLGTLYVSSNNLVGSIPTEIGLATSLIDFRVNSNNLVGTVPTEIGALTSLRTLQDILVLFSCCDWSTLQIVSLSLSHTHMCLWFCSSFRPSLYHTIPLQKESKWTPTN